MMRFFHGISIFVINFALIKAVIFLFFPSITWLNIRPANLFLIPSLLKGFLDLYHQEEVLNSAISVSVILLQNSLTVNQSAVYL